MGASGRGAAERTISPVQIPVPVAYAGRNLLEESFAVIDLRNCLVVGISSSALFDLEESDRIFREAGRSEYEQYQERLANEVLRPGSAFNFISTLLALNEIKPDLVEVIIMSRNSPSSGLRVMHSVREHGLPITRAIFREGLPSYEFMRALNMSLFLSSNRRDVQDAITFGSPAGYVLPGGGARQGRANSLRLAFDFDAVLADDEAERRYTEAGLENFKSYEDSHSNEPLRPGPLRDFLAGINRIQEIEEEQMAYLPSYEKRVRVSLVTARNAPAHERAVRSLESWGVHVDDAFFLGGLSKTQVLNSLEPSIFFDDQLRNLEDPELQTAAVHIPFGVHNVGPLSAPAKMIP